MSAKTPLAADDTTGIARGITTPDYVSPAVLPLQFVFGGSAPAPISGAPILWLEQVGSSTTYLPHLVV